MLNHYTAHFSEPEVRVWLRLRPDNYSEDLEPSERITRTIGRPPEWFVEDMWQTIEDACSPPWHCVESGEGWYFTETWTRWALRRGIAPGQPFLLRIEEPVWSQDYYGECDSSIEGEVVRMEEWSKQRIVNAWHGWQQQQLRARERARCNMRKLKQRQRLDRSAMYVRSYSWGVHSQALVRWSIYSRHRQVKGSSKGSCGELLREEGPAESSTDVRDALLKRASCELGIPLEKLKFVYF